MAKATISQMAAERRRGRPIESEQHAEIGRDAFAAAKAEPHRKEMAEKGAEPGGHGGVGAEMRPQPYGGGAFQQIEQQRERRQALVAGAQDIGRADIAGADLPRNRRARRAWRG